MKTIGLFFGSFNPIHHGHLILTQNILEQSLVNEVWFIISPHNPLKKKDTLIDEQHRLVMIQSVLKNHKNCKASDIEFYMPQPSYTVDTLTLLNQEHKHKFKIILGTDNLKSLYRWKNADQLINDNEFIVYPRLGHNKHNYETKHQFHFIKAPIIQISSTQIRNRNRTKQSIEFYTDYRVTNYIYKNKLYL